MEEEEKQEFLGEYVVYKDFLYWRQHRLLIDYNEGVDSVFDALGFWSDRGGVEGNYNLEEFIKLVRLMNIKVLFFCWGRVVSIEKKDIIPVMNTLDCPIEDYVCVYYSDGLYHGLY